MADAPLSPPSPRDLNRIIIWGCRTYRVVPVCAAPGDPPSTIRLLQVPKAGSIEPIQRALLIRIGVSSLRVGGRPGQRCGRLSSINNVSKLGISRQSVRRSQISVARAWVEITCHFLDELDLGLGKPI